MAYIGITGAFAVGKTTATDKLLTMGSPAIEAGEVSLVNCDVRRERWLSKGEVQEERVVYWKDVMENKQRVLLECLLDRDLYICETGRTDHITGLVNLIETGQLTGWNRYIVSFYVVTTTSAALKLFMQERCEMRNKTFNADYWDAKKLAYESSSRYTNSARKYLDAYSIPWRHIEVNYERDEWPGLLDVLCEDIARWRKMAN